MGKKQQQTHKIMCDLRKLKRKKPHNKTKSESYVVGNHLLDSLVV